MKTFYILGRKKLIVISVVGIVLLTCIGVTTFKKSEVKGASIVFKHSPTQVLTPTTSPTSEPNLTRTINHVIILPTSTPIPQATNAQTQTFNNTVIQTTPIPPYSPPASTTNNSYNDFMIQQDNAAIEALQQQEEHCKLVRLQEDAQAAPYFAQRDFLYQQLKYNPSVQREIDAVQAQILAVYSDPVCH